MESMEHNNQHSIWFCFRSLLLLLVEHVMDEIRFGVLLDKKGLLLLKEISSCRCPDNVIFVSGKYF